jgi:DNA-directed RNA polymerase subunit RPC12/RpoP
MRQGPFHLVVVFATGRAGEYQLNNFILKERRLQMKRYKCNGCGLIFLTHDKVDWFECWSCGGKAIPLTRDAELPDAPPEGDGTIPAQTDGSSTENANRSAAPSKE